MATGLKIIRRHNCAARSRLLHYLLARSDEFDDAGNPKPESIPQMPSFLARHEAEHDDDE